MAKDCPQTTFFFLTFAPAQCRRQLQWSELFPKHGNFLIRSTNLIAVSPSLP